ncbi:MAG: response regulator, partial [Nitrospiraceae bacterium]
MTWSEPFNRRILIVDDNKAIHDDFLKILQPQVEPDAMSRARSALFEESSDLTTRERYQVDCADQGQTALELVQHAREEGRRYAMAFVDMRMPPGWDGLETIEHLWKADEDLQVVICTAFSDHPWEEIKTRVGRNDKLLILQKPFEGVEVLQLASALCQKWDLTNQLAGQLRELSRLVDERTAELQSANDQLTQSNGA